MTQSSLVNFTVHEYLTGFDGLCRVPFYMPLSITIPECGFLCTLDIVGEWRYVRWLSSPRLIIFYRLQTGHKTSPQHRRWWISPNLMVGTDSYFKWLQTAFPPVPVSRDIVSPIRLFGGMNNSIPPDGSSRYRVSPLKLKLDIKHSLLMLNICSVNV